jgi:hypothetical protein
MLRGELGYRVGVKRDPYDARNQWEREGVCEYQHDEVIWVGDQKCDQAANDHRSRSAPHDAGAKLSPLKVGHRPRRQADVLSQSGDLLLVAHDIGTLCAHARPTP